MFIENNLETKHWKYSIYEKISDSFDKLNLSESDYKKLNSLKWVATEKIHGANFGIVTDGKYIKFAKRKAFLDHNENFFNFHQIKLQLIENAEKIYLELSKIINFKYLKLSGELFGGIYPIDDINIISKTAIQTGVYYTHDIQFLIFDISYTINENDNYAYIDYNIVIEILDKLNILYAKPLKIDTLDNILNFDIKFESTLFKKFNLPKLSNYNNFAEGIVIKPLKVIYLESKKGPIRPIIKMKIPEFSENKIYNNVTKNASPGKNYMQDFDFIIESSLNYITENRVNNVISKLGKHIDNMALSKNLVEDIIENYNENFENSFYSLNTADREFIYNYLLNECQIFVNTLEFKFF